MAQGKMKVKSKLPPNAKNKRQKKGDAVTKRANRPIQSKKGKTGDAHKLKQIISKTVNKAVEEEIRSRASCSKKFSKAQQAVAEHHGKATTN